MLQNKTVAGGFLQSNGRNRSGGSGNLISGHGTSRNMPASSSGPSGATEIHNLV